MGLAVAVDDREPPVVVEAVRSHPDVDEVECRRLAAGDVVVGDVGVERKTLSDYVGTLIGRSPPDLYDQVRRLVRAYEHAYVLLEAELPADGDAGVPAAAVRGSVASITARLGAPVVPCSDRERLVDLAIRLGRKHVEEPSRPALPAGAVTARDEPTTKRIYGCIEGVGPRTADLLYDAYPSVAAILRASRAELTTVDGVGPERADAIYESLRGWE